MWHMIREIGWEANQAHKVHTTPMPSHIEAQAAEVSYTCLMF